VKQTSSLIRPVDEEVHGADLCDLLLLSIQPQDLLTALLYSLILHCYSRPIVTDREGRETESMRVKGRNRHGREEG
jgi:hypothetical protein